jgi:hypothetical protein
MQVASSPKVVEVPSPLVTCDSISHQTQRLVFHQLGLARIPQYLDQDHQGCSLLWGRQYLDPYQQGCNLLLGLARRSHHWMYL